MATGTFDLIHPGHIFYLKKAKELGDELFVIVARDKTLPCNPIILEKQRKKVINSIEYVDKAILGSEKDKLDPIRKTKPNILVLGPDQKWDKSKVQKWVNRELEFEVKVKKVKEYKDCDLCSTSEIIEKIKKNY
ncbi:FAD synthase [archaeon SCG-AAA382B04]|nr:FAD synthase [archaeon SCG-AAA382B04]